MDGKGPKFGDREGSGPPIPAPRVPPIYEMSVNAVRTLDRLAIDEIGIPGIVLMENAAMGMLPIARRLIDRAIPTRAKRAKIVCGSGNNGGDGLALARHLLNAGIEVSVVLLDKPSSFRGDASINLRIVERMDIRIDGTDLNGEDDCCLVIDAMLGTGLNRSLGGVAAEMAAWMEAQRAEGALVLAVDVPSGLNADTGVPAGRSCVVADATATLAAVKPGLARLEAQRYVGELSVIDIGVPRALLEDLGQHWTPNDSAGRGV